jgi:hypothetical protein
MGKREASGDEGDRPRFRSATITGGIAAILAVAGVLRILGMRVSG